MPTTGTKRSERRGFERTTTAIRRGKIERVAVLEHRRGDGIGTELMAVIERTAAEAGYDELVLYAQVPVVDFYRKLGYRTEGSEFEDAGIPHRSMRKRL